MAKTKCEEVTTWPWESVLNVQYNQRDGWRIPWEVLRNPRCGLRNLGLTNDKSRSFGPRPSGVDWKTQDRRGHPCVGLQSISDELNFNMFIFFC